MTTITIPVVHTSSPLAAALLTLCLESEGCPAVWFTDDDGGCRVITMAPRHTINQACAAAQSMHNLARE